MNKSNRTSDGCTESSIAPSTDKDLRVQLVLSLVLGVSAFVIFCILRPRWPSLYAARKRRLDPRLGLPALPNTFFGWIPKLYSITEEQVVAAAGLDAFVFLTFFKMAIRLFLTMALLALAVLLPINYHYRHEHNPLGGGTPDPNSTALTTSSYYTLIASPIDLAGFDALKGGKGKKDQSREKAFLWSYVVFTYVFVGLTLYSINWETFRIIRTRQDYLGSQSTVTDRTFRLTGIPTRLRSEARLIALIERLGMGKVDTITLCRNWESLDDLMAERTRILRRLEESWAKFLGTLESSNKGSAQSGNGADRNQDANGTSPSHIGDEEAGEDWRLLESDSNRPHIAEGERPQVSIRYGLFGLRSRKVDAIDYYEEKLRRTDEKVLEAREKDYKPTDLALVTMDSVASCQMFIQARIDPRPGRLLTKATPSPSDLVWRNAYGRRGVRRLKSWAVTLFITVLTLLWIFPTAALASLLSLCNIEQVLPSFADWLSQHPILRSLLQNGVPTVTVSLLNVAVPYLYDWLSNNQGMISQGDVELSVISKNFFFIFFNTFFVFAVSKSGLDFYSTLQDLLGDTRQIPKAIAADVEGLSTFYISFVMLQGIGLMPFRILEFGSVVLLPVYRLFSVTPRDAAELRKPPAFQYGFYLPTSLLVFNLCLIYSVLRKGFAILLYGTIYFFLGYFAFKYMLLYAMDQPQHATGGAWRIICHRIVIGLLVFEIVMIGQIGAMPAYIQSVAVMPLIPFTIWYSYYFARRFEPLTRYIALRTIRSVEENTEEEAVYDEDEDDSQREATEQRRSSTALLRRGSTLDELREHGLTFVNPSLITPLLKPWIYKDPPPIPGEEDTTTDGSRSRDDPNLILPNADSSLGIGDNNVWQDAGGTEN